MKLTLRILNISVGIVIVVKLNAQTNIRVTPTIKEVMRYKIQPKIPCEVPAASWTDEVARIHCIDNMTKVIQFRLRTGPQD